MKFAKAAYLKDMKLMIDHAIALLQTEHPHFEVFTASIWTDANASASSVSFDSKTNSDALVADSKAWNKSHYDKHMAAGDAEQARLFEHSETRNTNPADFELMDFRIAHHASYIPKGWEEQTGGDCWEVLEPALMEIGAYAFERMRSLKLHPQFELGVNGPEDWYEFTWPAT